MMADAMIPRPGAANGVVPKNGIGIAFWIAGVPGSADMVKVEVPSTIAAGISRRGMAAARNTSCAIGTSTKKATNRLTPPYVTIAPARTTASMARRSPSRSRRKSAIADTESLSSMSLPNKAPSRNNGKNCARKVAALNMKVWVQLASSGSPENAAAMSAAAGASSSTLQPRSASQISRARPKRIPISPMRSHAFQQLVEIEARAPAQVLVVGVEECLRGAPSLVAQHAEEFPLGVELRRIAEPDHELAGDSVNPHVRPFGAFGTAGVSDLPQQRDHPQLLEQRGVERDLLEPVEDVARRARRPRPLDRIDLDEDRVAGAAFAYQRGDGRVAGIAAVPVALAVDLDGLEHGGQAGRREQHVRGDLAVAKYPAASCADVGCGDEELDRRPCQPVEIEHL